MSTIFKNYFQSTYTLKCLLFKLNFKLQNETEANVKLLNKTLENLSKIIITFDFDLPNNLKYTITRNHSYEQILYLTFININSSRLCIFKNHMFKHYFNQRDTHMNQGYLRLSDEELREKLLSFEHLALSYFLSHSPHDGYYWKQLHGLIGSELFRYILEYSSIFRRLSNTNETYVQVCGAQFNQVYHEAVDKLLTFEDVKRREAQLKKQKSDVKTEKADTPMVVSTDVTCENLSSFIDRQIVSSKLNDSKFDEAKYQLNKFGRTPIARRKILYDRNLGTQVPERFVYSIGCSTYGFSGRRKSRKKCQKKSQPPQPLLLPQQQQQRVNSVRLAVNKILNSSILCKINLTKYENPTHIEEMKSLLSIEIRKFILNYQTCPMKIYFSKYCEQKKKTTAEQNPANPMAFKLKTIRTRNPKRKRPDDHDSTDDEAELNTVKTNTSLLNEYIDEKNVYNFTRRCVMYVLGYKDKRGENDDEGAQLLGGKHNFKKIVKFIKKLLYALKHDTFYYNDLLNGIQLSKIKYLKPIQCDRYKRLILMAVLNWFVEDYILTQIRSAFYVTDTSATCSKLFFYSKKVWRQIVHELFIKQTENEANPYNLEKISDKRAECLFKNKETSGIYMGRLLPKNFNNELRIISGSRALNPSSKAYFGVNYKFISLHNCLKHIVKSNQSLIGFACNGHTEIQRKYADFVNYSVLNRPLDINNPVKKWNFTKIDVKKCFDSIDVNLIKAHLVEQFRESLGCNSSLFTILRYFTVKIDLDGRNLTKRHAYLTIKHRNHEKGFKYGIADFIDIFENEKKSRRTMHECMIIVPKAIHERDVGVDKLRDSLEKCLDNVIIKIHNQMFIRTKGILHGSICSRLLCDIYLGKACNAETCGLARILPSNRSELILVETKQADFPRSYRRCLPDMSWTT